MEPILLIHGYSSEGKRTRVEDIYGSLPADLRKLFGADAVREINLSRWISLNDGIRLDDVSFAMDRALNAEHAALLESGFHLIVHSTGALVARNWIRNFAYKYKPLPVRKLVHLAGANFGSGLAHVGQGQLARWGRLIFQGTGSGTRILNELEFGSWKTIDLHLHFLQPAHDPWKNHGMQEFCIAGSQTLPFLRPVPIRYVKEDSSDNTVRTSAVNLNFHHVAVRPRPAAFRLSPGSLNRLVEQRLEDEEIEDRHYVFEHLSAKSGRPEIPFAIAFETAHFGDDIGIVSGAKNRARVMPLIRQALETPPDPKAYAKTADAFRAATEDTLERAAGLKNVVLDWNRQAQYEGHAQLIFRLRDQFGNGVGDFDITFKSHAGKAHPERLEAMIEDTHRNRQDAGTLTFYLRTQRFDTKKKRWLERLDEVAPLDVEITGVEPLSQDIAFIPVNMRLSPSQVRAIVRSHCTTIVDVTLVRLPSKQVFEIRRG
jgi:hypothetical protein